jgi:hypothetical protein
MDDFFPDDNFFPDINIMYDNMGDNIGNANKSSCVVPYAILFQISKGYMCNNGT